MLSRVIKNVKHSTNQITSNSSALRNSNLCTVNQLHSSPSLTGNIGMLQRLAIIQRETPAEILIMNNSTHPVDDRFALIGSDNVGSSPLADELQRCLDENMMMPHTLAKHLNSTGESWSKKLNNEWMEVMISQGKFFKVTHNEIIAALNKGEFGNTLQKRFRKKPPTGTWLEVQTLIHNNYIWCAEYDVFLPPGSIVNEFIKWVEGIHATRQTEKEDPSE